MKVKREDAVALGAFAVWVGIIIFLIIMAGCDSATAPCPDAGAFTMDATAPDTVASHDATPNVDVTPVEAQGADAAVGEGGTSPDATDDAGACPSAPSACSLALNPNPQSVCVSPSQGPYNTYWTCTDGARFCCVPSTTRGCAYKTCVRL